MEDPLKNYVISRIIAVRFTGVYLATLWFTVTVTLEMNDNENAWEYPSFSMLPDRIMKLLGFRSRPATKIEYFSRIKQR